MSLVEMSPVMSDEEVLRICLVGGMILAEMKGEVFSESTPLYRDGIEVGSKTIECLHDGTFRVTIRSHRGLVTAPIYEDRNFAVETYLNVNAETMAFSFF